MINLTRVESCLEVTDDHVEQALAPARALAEPSPRDKVLELLTHMASVAKPSRGGPKILLVIARMATRDWVEGEIEVHIRREGNATEIDILVDDGLMTERILPSLKMDVPYAEFSHGLTARPTVVLPLRVTGDVGEVAVKLRTTPQLRSTSMPPAFSAVSPSLLPTLEAVVLPGERPAPLAAREPAPQTRAEVEARRVNLPLPSNVDRKPEAPHAQATGEEESRSSKRQRISMPARMENALDAIRKKKG